MPREEDIVGIDAATRRLQLVQEDFEPQLISLVSNDEQQLVVLVAEPLLQLQQLGDLEVRAIGEPPPLLTEPASDAEPNA